MKQSNYIYNMKFGAEEFSGGNDSQFIRGGVNELTFLSFLVKKVEGEDEWKSSVEIIFTTPDGKRTFKWFLKNLQNDMNALATGLDWKGNPLSDQRKEIMSNNIKEFNRHMIELRKAITNSSELTPIESDSWLDYVQQISDELYSCGAVDVRLLLTYELNKSKGQYYLQVPRFAKSNKCSFIENASVEEANSQVIKRSKEDKYIKATKPAGEVTDVASLISAKDNLYEEEQIAVKASSEGTDDLPF